MSQTGENRISNLLEEKRNSTRRIAVTFQLPLICQSQIRTPISFPLSLLHTISLSTCILYTTLSQVISDVALFVRTLSVCMLLIRNIFPFHIIIIIINKPGDRLPFSFYINLLKLSRFFTYHQD